MVFKWNEDNTLRFLECFKNYSCLWNHKLDEYKDRTIRANAMKALISDLNLEVTEEDIKHKIKTIRTRYTTELTKIKQSTKSGCSSDDVYLPSLYWFKYADFLSSVCVPRHSTSNLDVPASSENTDLTSEESNPTADSVGQKENDVRTSVQKTANVFVKPINRKRKNETAIDKAIKELKAISEETRTEPEHEFDLFCKSLAVQLKHMPLDRALRCQEKLQSVIINERLSQISSVSSYSDSSRSQSPQFVVQSPPYENTSSHQDHHYRNQQQFVSPPMISPQEIESTSQSPRSVNQSPQYEDISYNRYNYKTQQTMDTLISSQGTNNIEFETSNQEEENDILTKAAKGII